MNEPTLRPAGPSTVVECPWCEAAMAIDEGPATGIRCDRCSIVLEFARDAPQAEPRSLRTAA